MAAPEIVIVFCGLVALSTTEISRLFLQPSEIPSHTHSYMPDLPISTPMSSGREAAILEHGFTAVSRDIDNKILKGAKNVKDPIPLSTEDINFPSEALVQKVQEYAKAHLNEQTFNHSMRVYYYGNFLR